MTRRHRRTSQRSHAKRVASFLGALVLAFSGIVTAAPAYAEVTVDSVSDFDVQCNAMDFRVNGGGTISLGAGDSATSYLRVDGVAPDDTKPITSEGDQTGVRIGAATPLISDDAVHLVEWVLNDKVQASGEFSYLEDCEEPAPAEATVTFTDAVCSSDGRAVASAVVEFAESTKSGVSAEVKAGDGNESSIYTAVMGDDFRAIVEFPVAADGATLATAVQRYRPTMTASLGEKTYEPLAPECTVVAPLPGPTEEPEIVLETPAPEDAVGPTPDPVETEAPSPQPVDDVDTIALVAAQPIVALPSESVTVGGSLDLNVSGFAAEEVLEIWVHSKPVKLGVATTDASGNLIQTATLPVEVPPGAHRIEVRGVMSGSVFVPIAVNDNIAFTGFDAAVVSGTVTTGLVLVLGGVAVVLLARRARSEVRL